MSARYRIVGAATLALWLSASAAGQESVATISGTWLTTDDGSGVGVVSGPGDAEWTFVNATCKSTDRQRPEAEVWVELSGAIIGQIVGRGEYLVARLEGSGQAAELVAETIHNKEIGGEAWIPSFSADRSVFKLLSQGGDLLLSIEGRKQAAVKSGRPLAAYRLPQGNRVKAVQAFIKSCYAGDKS